MMTTYLQIRVRLGDGPHGLAHHSWAITASKNAPYASCESKSIA